MQLGDLFASTFAARRDDVAVEFGDGGSLEVLTFGEVAARASQMSVLLARRGLTRGDRVAVYLPNCLAFVDVFIAAATLGLIVVPINILYREREIAHIVADADPKAIIARREARDLFPAGSPVWDVEDLVARASATDAAALPPRTAFEGDEPAAIVYTSGTTGKAKGAVLSHDNFLANAANLIACWRITAADRYLAVLPLFHVHGMANGLVCWLASGCRMRLVERFEAARAADWFTSFEPTLFFGVPTVYVRLLELPADVARGIGRTMRLFVSGSAPLPVPVFDAFRERFGHSILERYGMSETLMNVSNPYAGERRAGTVGFPLPGVTTRIVDANGHEAGGDDVGELLIRGPNLFSGYWRRPDATADAFVDGWFRTGDMAQRSIDGYLTLCGRRTDLIISGGFNIYPREIEELLLEVTGIREAVVVAAADDRRGEVPVAYVVASGQINVAAIEETCRRSLASFKMPRAFVQVDSLPRTALGKVQKHLLPPWRPSPP